MVTRDYLELCKAGLTIWDGNAQCVDVSATLADEVKVGKARQGDGDGDRVAKQARPIEAKTWRSTRCQLSHSKRIHHD